MKQEKTKTERPAGEPVPRLRLRDALWGVFFFPHVILPLLVVPGSWGRAWRLFTAGFAISCLLLAFVHLPRFQQIAESESARLAVLVGEVKVEKTGKLVFPAMSPGAEIRCQAVSCVIHFARPGQALALDEIKANDLWCVWVSDRAICLMRRDRPNSLFQQMMVVPNGDWPWAGAWVKRCFPTLNAMLVPGSSLTQPQAATFFLELHQSFTPGFFLLDRLGSYIILVLMMVVIAVMLSMFPGSRVLGDGRISSSLALFFYAGIPALVLATIWCLVPGVALENFPFIYLWTLAGYLAVVLFVLRRQAAAQDDDGPND
jgi:hypothetical protein